MTDEELKALVAENSRAIHTMQVESEKQRQESAALREKSEKRWDKSHQESERIWRQVVALREESEKRWEESEKRWEESTRESEKRWEESRQESERIWQEVLVSRRESDRIWQEVLVSRRESDRVLSSFNRQLGQFGNLFGDYTECVFRPSLERILREHFGMPSVFHLDTQHEGEDFEVDLVGHAGNKVDEVYLVEIKSQLREDGIEQILRHLRQFTRVLPEHRGKKLFGILAALKIPEKMRKEALSEGLHLVTVNDNVFELTTPEDFTPRAFGIRGLSAQL